MPGHSRDPHPESLISRIYNESNEPSVSNDSLDAIETENSNITEGFGEISNQMDENGELFLIGKWILL